MFVTKEHFVVQTYICQLSKACYSESLKEKYPKSKKCPSLTYDLEKLWNSLQVQKEIVLEEDEVSVKLVRVTCVKPNQEHAIDEADDKDDTSESGLSQVDAVSFDEKDNPETEDDYSEQENLLYTITGNGKKFQSAVSTSEDTPECLKLFKTFQEKSFEKAKFMGLFVNTHLHEILSLYNIILLKKEQDFPKVDMSSLQEEMLREYASIERIDESVFSKIVEAFRTVEDISSRRDELKIILFSIYTDAGKEDRKLIDVLINLVNKLPKNKVLNNEVKEQELIINYVDPILSPILHRPEDDRLFLWLDKTTTGSFKKKPDAGCVTIYERRIANYSCFVEAKAEYKKKDAVSLHEDLLHLSIFGNNSLEENNNDKCILLLQIIGSSLTVYGCAEHAKGPKIIFEIMTFNVPLSLQELPGFLMNLDQLKRLSHFYHEHCVEVKGSKTTKRKPTSSRHNSNNIDLEKILNINKPKGLKSSIIF